MPAQPEGRDLAAAARADLAGAVAAGDQARAALLAALLESGGRLVEYLPERRHYAVAFGELERSRHVAVLVPGVGDDDDLRAEWLPSAKNLFEAAAAVGSDEPTAVVMWKGYDNPRDLAEAAVAALVCDERAQAGATELHRFVASLDLREDQTLALVAHSYGSMVVGCALADLGLGCTDVVVAGSPGMTVDGLRALHLEASHLFVEEAPGDLVADLGLFGADPGSPTFGGTRLRTNFPDHVAVRAHSSYFVPGSEALENIVDVVTCRYARVEVRRPSLAERAGSAVAWALRLPTVPIAVAARHYEGPGHRIAENALHLADLGATESGRLVCGTLERGEAAIAHLVDRALGLDG